MAEIDVVIPTVTGREDSLVRCVESYQRNTAPDALNLIVIRDEPTVGRAWREGIKQSTAPYIALSCDDLEMTSPTWGAVCMEAADAGRLPCPIVRRPDGRIESCGGDMSAPACLISYMQPDGAETDFAPVPFGSREQVKAIGMIESHYESDTYFSHKGRELGWPTVITYGYELTHHHAMEGRRHPTAEDSRLYEEAMAR